MEGRIIRGRRVVRATRTEFEMDDGAIYPFFLPFDYEPSIKEIQKHYDRACDSVQGLQDDGDNNKNLARLGRQGKD